MNPPITREQFELVRPLLEAARKKTRPRQHDLYDIVCAILAREQHGLTWRTLPAGSPPWRTVHEYHTQWSMPAPGGAEPLMTQIYRALEGVWPPKDQP
jgi:transposase